MALILEAFTAKELKDINAFYKTKSGKAYAEKSPWLSAELSKLIMENLNNVKLDTKGIDCQLSQIAEETNKQLPLTLDAHTRLDSSVGGNREFTYVYTIISYSAEEITFENLRESLYPNLLNNYCSSDSMKFFRDNNIKVNFAYSGKNGTQIGTISVNYQLCSQQ